MKRLLVTFMALTVLDAVSADWTPIQLSLCPPAQLFRTETEVYGLRANILLGHNARVAGLDLGVVNFADDLTAIQLGVMNGARGFDGIQIGLINFVGGLGAIGEVHLPSASAVEDVAPLIHLRGVQVGLFNDSGNKGPMSLPRDELAHSSRVTSWREPEQSGMPRGMPADKRYEYSGIQLGIANFADRIRGVQIGTLVNEADEVHGLQIAIFKNYARVLHGVQIGLLNRADNGVLLQFFPGEIYGFPIINAAF